MAKSRMLLPLLLSLSLFVPGSVNAQCPGGACGPTPGYPPPGYGEPVPIQTMGAPGGPMPGQEWPLSLSNDGSPNAFNDDLGYDDPYHQGMIFTVGAMALERVRLGNSLLAVQDQRPGGFLNGVDTGLLPPARLPAMVSTADVQTPYSWGPRASVGFHYGDSTVEFSGFYLPNQGSTFELIETGRIDLPFAFFGNPTELNANAGVWLQADRIRVTFETEMAGAEGNYRYTSGNNFEWIIGVRYLDMAERFSIFVDDEIGGDVFEDPTMQATYTTRTHSRILAPQLGGEGGFFLCPWVAVGGMCKGAWGVNFTEIDTAVFRGDDLIPRTRPRTSVSSNQFSQIYEINLFADFLCGSRCFFRAGYQALWLVGVPEAVDQINFNVFDLTSNSGRTAGTIFYHGPMLTFNLRF